MSTSDQAESKKTTQIILDGDKQMLDLDEGEPPEGRVLLDGRLDRLCF